MYKLTQAGLIGAGVLVLGYLIGALVQDNFLLGSWPLPVRLLILVFAVTAFLLWSLIAYCFTSDAPARRHIQKRSRGRNRRK
ncbi:hypothetical protein [Kushneria phosphatilytica]|uniref:Uncharacterized protein n=1 Tax=Kushneria phosphatilytica TaxID=657387 RepID=A0A1S1NU69_9GAMM|nr:hypothetical protein [Kushneria phosphatilytica]OHV08038.1 hypothetical protein BH688_14620 [Kushneria phosphatilytica]QEL09951.1 hypothetical protein FY550_01590 [Kushneria phosphatilytica]